MLVTAMLAGAHNSPRSSDCLAQKHSSRLYRAAWGLETVRMAFIYTQEQRDMQVVQCARRCGGCGGEMPSPKGGKGKRARAPRQARSRKL